MVTLVKNTDQTSSSAYEWRGKSTDTKPTQNEYNRIPNGSSYFEFDTGNIYFWDADAHAWI